MSSDDDFFIPTGEELDRGEVPAKPRKRGLFGPQRQRQNRQPVAARRQELPIDVPESVARQEPQRKQNSKPRGDELRDSGSTGDVVRSIEISAGVPERELIIPDEIRAKYRLDE